MPKKISLKEIQDLTGSAYKTVKKRLADAEINPVGEAGSMILYDSAIALEAFYRGKGTDTGDDVRLQLIAEQHREKKRENDIAEGLIAPVSMLSDSLHKVINQVVPILDAIPLEMKRSNPKLTAHDIQTVKKAIAKARNAAAEVRIDTSNERVMGDSRNP